MLMLGSAQQTAEMIQSQIVCTASYKRIQYFLKSIISCDGKELCTGFGQKLTRGENKQNGAAKFEEWASQSECVC